MGNLIQDLRYGTRQLVKNPLFSAVAVGTLALGIGATTLIFSVANALLLRPLPVEDPAALVTFEEIGADGSRSFSLSYPHLQDYRSGSGEAVRIVGSGFGDLSFSTGDEATVLTGNYVTGDYFEVLGLEPALGRFFAPEEETPGVPEPVAVIGHDVWRDYFGADPGVIGTPVRMNGHVLTVIGVAPPEFHGVERIIPADLWVPIPMYTLLNPGSEIDHPTRHDWLSPAGRLSPGTTRAQAEAVLSEVGRGIEPRWQDDPVRGVEVSALSGLPAELGTPVRVFLGILFATASLVLLIACVNVAGMLLARGTVRRREVGIRLALGAGRRRLVAQLLTESTLLFVLGGAVGLLLAWWLTGALAAFLPSLPFGASVDLSLDGGVVAFALLVSLAVGLLFGLVPALGASKSDVLSSLKGGAEGVAGSGSRLRSAFVSAQIALSLVLLVSAGLLARALQDALTVDPGIDPEGVMVAGLNLGPHGYDDTTGFLFFEQLRDRLELHPAVRSVAYARLVPLTFNQIVRGVRIPGHEPPPGRSTFAIDYNAVDGSYFETVGMPIVQGRAFDDRDGPESPGVVVVNETMARTFWPDGDALGSRIGVPEEPHEIVGIVRDAKYYRLHEDPLPFLYLPLSQEELAATTLHVRSEGGGTALLADIARSELRSLDADVPLIGPASLEDRTRIALLPQRVGVSLIGAFGVVGLLLAAVGLYGLLAYMVGQRTREIGVRIALGARPRSVIAMVIRQGGVLLAVGLALGLLLALGGTRLLSGLLLEVSPTDPLTFLTVPFILAVATLLAAYLPARRATRVDPVVALRSD